MDTYNVTLSIREEMVDTVDMMIRRLASLTQLLDARILIRGRINQTESVLPFTSISDLQSGI